VTDYQYFVLNVNPEPWAIGPVGYARRNGKMSAYVGQNKQLDAYKQAIKEELGTGHKMLEGPVDLRFYFWRVRDEYTTPQGRAHRKHEADATNMQKATEDALQGVLFANDKDVQHVESWIIAQGPDVEPRVVVGVKRYEEDYLLPDGVLVALANQPELPFDDDSMSWSPPEEGMF
jgi:Holliday junction resolvase RusA-like endonuclease